MGILETLFQGTPRAPLPTTNNSSTSMPAWYEDFIRGIAANSVGNAAGGYTPYAGPRLAPFNPDQTDAFQLARDNAGDWRAPHAGALTAAGSAVDTATTGANTANNYGIEANTAVGGPTQTWDTAYSRYMSPYTSNVVNEISRLGNKNITENLVPGINSGFIGGGGFGSTRNAELMGRGLREAQTNISGLQSTALQNGWTSGMSAFASDADRLQRQGALQAETALGAGNLALSGANLGVNAAGQQATQLGALATSGQQMGTNDVASLGAIGGAQQDLQQRGLDVGYNEFLQQRDWDRGTLSWLGGVLNGAQMPTTTTSNGTTSGGYNPSPLAWLSSLYGFGRAAAPAPANP